MAGRTAGLDVVTRTQDRLAPGNNTIELLGAGATFTGEWVPTDGYAQTTVMVTSDVESATGGVLIQHSSDGVNVDYKSTREYTDNVGNGVVYTVPTRGRYVRVIYTNGGDPQTVFRLQTYQRVAPSSAAIQELDTAVGNHVQALITKSSIIGKTTAGGGSYVDVKVAPSGALTVEAAVTGSLVPYDHDYIELGYTGDDLTTVVYKTGGSGGTTVATLTLAYDTGKLTSVTRT